MPSKIISVITPTTGEKSLFNLIKSIVNNAEKSSIPTNHIILWDNKRSSNINPLELCNNNTQNYSINNIIINEATTNKEAKGSALRAIGLLSSFTEFVTFSDSDIMWEDNHLKTMLGAIKDKNWAFCKRKIWAKLPDDKYEYLGIDEFESVGEDAKTPYKMVDNNSMIFRRRFGSSAAPLYRETDQYNDDRLMYEFLRVYAGEPGKTNLATINQICPHKLIDFFRENCTRD